MMHSAIDTFYLTDEQLWNSPSRKDGIDEATETTLRIYGCGLIQERGISLKLPQVVVGTAEVLFHRFYCKKSFAHFNVKKVAASSIWIASKIGKSPTKAKHILHVFHKIECRRENLPIEHLDLVDMYRMEKHILSDMGFICHVELPHKFIVIYLAILDTPPELRQEAWNLANDSLRTTLCVRFKSSVVACGIIYAAARRCKEPLPENPPWWKAFDAHKSEIDEICRVLSHLYSLPKAVYVQVCKETSPSQPVPSTAVNMDISGSKEALIKAALDKLKVPMKSDDDSRERERDRKRSWNSDRELEHEGIRDRYKAKDKGNDSGHLEKLTHNSPRRKFGQQLSSNIDNNSWERDRKRVRDSYYKEWEWEDSGRDRYKAKEKQSGRDIYKAKEKDSGRDRYKAKEKNRITVSRTKARI